MNPQQKIVPFVSERDRLLVQAMHQLFYAIILIRSEPTENSLGIACALAKDAAGILDAVLHFPAEPHPRFCPIELDELSEPI